MALVVWAIKAHAIPAGRKSNLSTDTTLAHSGGKECRVFPCARGTAEGLRVFVDAAMADAAGLACGVAKKRVAGEHTEALL
jgi:hypothetical protein